MAYSPMRLRQDRDTTGNERGYSLQTDKQLLIVRCDLQPNTDDCGGIFNVDQRPIQQPFGGFGRDLVERISSVVVLNREAVSVHEVDLDGVLPFFVRPRSYFLQFRSSHSPTPPKQDQQAVLRFTSTSPPSP